LASVVVREEIAIEIFIAIERVTVECPRSERPKEEEEGIVTDVRRDGAQIDRGRRRWWEKRGRRREEGSILECLWGELLKMSDDFRHRDIVAMEDGVRTAADVIKGVEMQIGDGAEEGEVS
jgi:hypothetical protein